MSIVNNKKSSFLALSQPEQLMFRVIDRDFLSNWNSLYIVQNSVLICKVGVDTADIWYVNPNVSNFLKNYNFKFISSAANPEPHTVVIADGLYSVEALSNAISNVLKNRGWPLNMIALSLDDATQKTVVSFWWNLNSVDSKIAQTLKYISEFNAAVYMKPVKVTIYTLQVLHIQFRSYVQH